jgi:RsiW-degrading membrane proteinase PrsW (M82 family)
MNADPATAGWVPATKSSTPVWLRHLHWCLALAMIPLAVVVVLPGESEEELIGRLERAVQAASEPEQTESPPTESPPVTSVAESSDESVFEFDIEEMTLDDVLATLPSQRLDGALLSRNTWWHWGFALLSVAAYMTFFIFLASDGSAKAPHLLGVGLFVATFGILLLVIVQVASGIGLGGSGPEALIRLILTIIGLSYSAALDPESGFFSSFVGFTLGVGLCEEVCKALPVFVYYRFQPKQNWRGAFLWGLAAGAGFGVAEGIFYSQDYYNGIVGLDIYLVRFVSCVALHAVWTGTIGIAINQRQEMLRWELEQWWRMPIGIVLVLAVPMVLHGLYDTMLKKDLDLLALVVAAASFGYLAWTISRLRTSDDEDERAAYVAKYIRSQQAAAP